MELVEKGAVLCREGDVGLVRERACPFLRFAPPVWERHSQHECERAILEVESLDT